MLTKDEVLSALDSGRLFFTTKRNGAVLVQRKSPTVTWRDGSFTLSVLLGNAPGTLCNESLNSNRYLIAALPARFVTNH